MSQHSDNILLYLESIRNQKGVNKLLNIIEDIICQFKENQLERTIESVNRHVSPRVKNKAIQIIILNSILTNGQNTLEYDKYLKEKLAQFTSKEEMSILKNKDLTKYVDAPFGLAQIIYIAIFEAFTIIDNS